MKIIVAGAGTAGLASATLLARQGHDVIVIEAVSSLAPVGAGLLIQPSGQKVLRTLGVLEQLQQRGSPIDALHGYNRRMQRVLDLDYTDIDTFGLGLHRAHLADALHQVAFASGVSFRFGHTVTRVSQQETHVTITLASGAVEHADMLVIAYGTRSTLREQLTLPTKVTPYPWGALWAICESDAWHSPRILGQLYDGPRKMLGVLPSGRHPLSGRPCYSLFWSLPRAQYTAWQLQPFEMWLNQLQEHWPALAPLLKHLQRSAVAWAEYSDVVMPHWHHGRMVCIGDAAHAMSPQLGQGANLALIDAYVLAHALKQQTSVAVALAQYSEQRKAHLRYYQRASRWLTPLYQSELPLGTLRDWGTRFSKRVPFLYQQALATLTGHKAGLFSRFDMND